MPTIKNLKEQEKALKEAKGLISEIKKLKEFINKNYEGREYKISFDTQPDPLDYPITITASLICDNKNIINGMVLKYKDLLVEKLLDIKDKNNIILDEEDMRIVWGYYNG